MDFILQNEKTKNLKESKVESNYLVWNKKVPDTQLEKFKKIIEEKYNLKFQTYWDMHSWSVTNFPNFWEEVWNYFGIVSSQPHDEVFVKSGPGFLDHEWFKGATFNYAENILRIRDDSEALLCLDEEGNFEKVTFAKMFEEVKLYAAAFKKHGLKKGDTVACYMSNRKEAIYAMLAATSIGAIWGGPQPFLGARAASYIVTRLEAKFLIAVDSFVDYGEEHSIMDNLPFIAENAPTLEKIIIVPTKEVTLSKDISHIPNSCFLGPFLESGKTPNGEIPDIVFEQLPFDHPVSVAFTSGTTGMPKGAVHSAGFTCRNCGGGDRGRVTIYRPFGEVSLSLNRTVTCMVLKANETDVSLALATMNFVGLVLTTSDSRTFLTGCDVSVDCSTLSTGEELSIAHIQPYIGHHDREGDLA
ncbi:acetoacetyl-CoA synthetase [Trichonephila clavipes]|nr:acetoacetyl-CoA synthetase [Trichonephila clavipes]